MFNYRFPLMFGLAWVASVLPSAFCQNPSAAAQGDSFNSNTNGGGCRQAHSQALEKVAERKIQIVAQWHRDVADCAGNSSCVHRAMQRREAEERDVLKESIDADFQNDICEERSRARDAIPSQDPCEQTYRQAVETIAEHSIRIVAQWRRDMADCLGNGSSCVQRALQKREAEERQLDKERIDASAEKDVCEQRRRLKGQLSGANPRSPADSGGRNPPARQNGGNPGSKATNENRGPIAYLRGNVDGLGDCLQGIGLGLLNTWGAIDQMRQGNFVAAADLLGLEPQDDVVMRGIWMELLTPRVHLQAPNVTDYENGRIAGPRVCQQLLMAKAAQRFGGKIADAAGAGGAALRNARKALGTQGATPLNPLRGKAIIANATDLEGKWIQPKQSPVPIKIGNFRAAGKTAAVYEKSNGTVIKVTRDHHDAHDAMAGQAKGTEWLAKNTNVAAPKIRQKLLSPTPDEASLLVVDDVNTKFPNGRLIDASTPVDPIHDVHTSVGDAGGLATDLHRNNLFQYTGPDGKTRVGILDTDRIAPVSEIGTNPGVGKDLFNLFRKYTVPGFDPEELYSPTPNARRIMDALFQIRYGNAVLNDE